MINTADEILKYWSLIKECLLMAKLRDNANAFTNFDFHDVLVREGIIVPDQFEPFNEIYARVLLRLDRNYGILRYSDFSSQFYYGDTTSSDRTQWNLPYDKWSLRDETRHLMLDDPTFAGFREVVAATNARYEHAIKNFRNRQSVTIPE